MRRLLLVVVGFAILVATISAEAGFLDRKNTFLVGLTAGYQMPRDDNLRWVYKGGISMTALGGYHFTGHFAALGKATYRNYHRQKHFGLETGGRLTVYSAGAGLKWNMTQGYFIIPYISAFGNLARYTNAGPNGTFVSNVPQAEAFFGIEFFLRPELIADASLGYYKSFGEMTFDNMNYTDTHPEGASKLPIEAPVEPEGILFNFGFAVFL